MKKQKYLILIFLALFFSSNIFGASNVLKNRKMEIDIDENGNLVTLKNLLTGHNYATGKPIWRLYFDTHNQKGNEVLGKNNIPNIKLKDNQILITYNSLKTSGKQINVRLSLRIILENDWVRFCSEVTNNEPHTIIRELQFPLVSDCQLPADCKLLTTTLGGQIFPDPKKQILEVGNNPPYMAPSQYFRQMDLKYPSVVSANCFAFPGNSQGLYLASHDSQFRDTWHGLRLYPDKKGDFTELEAGIYKYPNCTEGQTWSCDANVIAPYQGNWHETSRLYRKWADTWWKHVEPPLWVKNMKSWQRIIFRHQYGEIFFRYKDLPERILNAGKSVEANTVFPFGWWDSGMDNGYPDSYFQTDQEQGGDAGWKKSIAEFKEKGGKLLLYFNGKLIDTGSNYYKKDIGKSICCKRNTGMDYTEAYLFKAHDTFTGSFNARSFVVADLHRQEWQKMLLSFADRAIFFGANAVFYDQLGYLYGEQNWDIEKEFPVPNRNGIVDRANVLKMIHEYIGTKDKNFGLGTEGITDITSQYVDFIHNLTGTGSPVSFIEWYRYTFPEVIISDREIRDDTDVERRVNFTVLKGLRNDIEIYRCRELIDKTPVYQDYLAKANHLKGKYNTLLLEGTYRDTEGFNLNNKLIDARCFTNGKQMAVVATLRDAQSASGNVDVPGYHFVESDMLGKGNIKTGSGGKQNITLEKNGLIVMIFEK